MGTTEKFCLRWNDFESNISGAFKELRQDSEFFDVTLVSCDDAPVRAHKVILAACSPFFKRVLQTNPHQNPLLYLKGVRHQDLLSVLDFIYHGEVNVAQDELNSFLGVAEELAVKGLTSDTKQPPQQTTSRPKVPDVGSMPKKRKPVASLPPPTPAQQPKYEVKSEPDYVPEQPQVSEEYEGDNSYDAYAGDESNQYLDGSGYDSNVDANVMLAGGGADGNKDLLKFIVRSETGPRDFSCTACGRTSTRRADLMRHVEAIHCPREYRCPECPTVVTTLWNFQRHMKAYHFKAAGSPSKTTKMLS